MDALTRFADAWLAVFALHMVEVSAFILLVWGVDRTFRLSARLRYTLWLLALAKVFLPPLVRVPPLWESSVVAAPVEEAVVAAEGVVTGPVAAEALRVAPSVLLLGVWVVSVLVLAGIVAWKHVAFRRRLSGARPVKLPATVLPGRREAFRLRAFSVEWIPSPALAGFLRPRVYLPTDWAAWPEAHLRSILAHELAHFRGRDLWVLALQTLSLLLFGLNPLVWVLYRRLAHVRELRCDEAAIGLGRVTPVEYSRLLYGFVERQVRRPEPGLSGICFTEGGRSVQARLRHVLGLKEGEMRTRKPWHTVVLVVVGLAILPLSVREGESGAVTVTAQSEDTEARDEVQVVLAESAAEPRPEVSRFTHEDLDRVAEVRGRAVSTGHFIQNVRLELAQAEAGKDSFKSQEAVKEASKEEAKTGIVEFWAVEGKPDLVKQVMPEYPEEARKAGVEGSVYVQFVVGTDGRVSDVRVLRGPQIFREAAVDVAKQFVFSPARHDGEPVAVRMSMPIRFRLAGKGKKALTGKPSDARQSDLCEVWLNAKGEMMIDLEKRVGLDEVRSEIKRRLAQNDRLTVLFKVDEKVSKEVFGKVLSEVRLSGARVFYDEEAAKRLRE